MGLVYRLGHVCPLSITSESSQASCFQCCSAVAWCSDSQGGRRHDQGRKSCRKVRVFHRRKATAETFIFVIIFPYLFDSIVY
jgi:hypothetical protein